ncbi:hypothetical protein [Desulfoglaeba alkanexedens]|uniref:Uncharacterized protein n=1 Tax=Desulfoglaeba alkanexedens ALDC TaxID=980445 RepID=A0A4P8L1N8_9BACT|nr:hypothetical protein [Desulfoglaeba alkanexedens]QCQ21690.1 hypothetical protein FDQ92_05540 [Desulfoglaeba alkanexedens ALDC]
MKTRMTPTGPPPHLLAFQVRCEIDVGIFSGDDLDMLGEKRAHTDKILLLPKTSTAQRTKGFEFPQLFWEALAFEAAETIIGQAKEGSACI